MYSDEQKKEAAMAIAAGTVVAATVTANANAGCYSKRWKV
jgi:hypothetical protein